MDDYDVRSRYAYDDAYGGGTDYAKAAEFDAWLAERDRVVAANAWDEGYNVGGHAASGDYSGIYGGNGQEPPNPYRITEENN